MLRWLAVNYSIWISYGRFRLRLRLLLQEDSKMRYAVGGRATAKC